MELMFDLKAIPSREDIKNLGLRTPIIREVELLHELSICMTQEEAYRVMISRLVEEIEKYS